MVCVAATVGQTDLPGKNHVKGLPYRDCSGGKPHFF